jgi:uncharacterized protein (DUF302 family)
MRTLYISLSFFIFSSLVAADNGLITVISNYNVATTSDRLEHSLVAKGMTVFTRINHAQAAAKIGKELRPTELVIFGNPKVGSLLMQCQQSIAIDLPQKALIWEDEKGKVWLSYNETEYLAMRHGIVGCDEVLQKITNALSNFAKAATEK